MLLYLSVDRRYVNTVTFDTCRVHRPLTDSDDVYDISVTKFGLISWDVYVV